MIRQTTRILTTLLIATLGVLFLAACEPEEVEAPTAIPVEEEGEALGNIAPSEGSSYENVIIWVESADSTGASVGAEAGSLVLTLTIQNTSDETQTIGLSSEDYVVLDADGLSLEAIIVSDDLVMPELEAGESVTGTAEFSTLDTTSSTYVLSISGFERTTVDASVAPE